MKLALRTAVFCAATTLFALPSYANCTGGPFNGPYIGGTLGWAHLRAEHSFGSSPSDSDDAFAAGAHIGYNLQCGQFVGGIEADINYADLSARNFFPDPTLPTFIDSSIDWYGTVRGRLGVVVHPRVLLYATAGLAYADVEQRVVVPTVPFSQTDTEFKTGWTIGGGLELLHHGRWMLRTEVLYVDLGDNSRTYTFTGGPCIGTCTGTPDFDESFWVARVGLSLKLHHEPKPVPLK